MYKCIANLNFRENSKKLLHNLPLAYPVTNQAIWQLTQNQTGAGAVTGHVCSRGCRQHNKWLSPCPRERLQLIKIWHWIVEELHHCDQDNPVNCCFIFSDAHFEEVLSGCFWRQQGPCLGWTHFNLLPMVLAFLLFKIYKQTPRKVNVWKRTYITLTWASCKCFYESYVCIWYYSMFVSYFALYLLILYKIHSTLYLQNLNKFNTNGTHDGTMSGRIKTW